MSPTSVLLVSVLSLAIGASALNLERYALHSRYALLRRQALPSSVPTDCESQCSAWVAELTPCEGDTSAQAIRSCICGPNAVQNFMPCANCITSDTGMSVSELITDLQEFCGGAAGTIAATTTTAATTTGSSTAATTTGSSTATPTTTAGTTTAATAGSSTGPVTTPAFGSPSSEQGVTNNTVSNSDSRINYQPPSAWQSISEPGACSGSTVKQATQIGSSFSFTFQGTGLIVQTATGPNSGVYTVTVAPNNGSTTDQSVQRVDGYSAEPTPCAVGFAIQNLLDQEYNIIVEIVGPSTQGTAQGTELDFNSIIFQSTSSDSNPTGTSGGSGNPLSGLNAAASAATWHWSSAAMSAVIAWLAL